MAERDLVAGGVQAPREIHVTGDQLAGEAADRANGLRPQGVRAPRQDHQSPDLRLAPAPPEPAECVREATVRDPEPSLLRHREHVGAGRVDLLELDEELLHDVVGDHRVGVDADEDLAGHIGQAGILRRRLRLHVRLDDLSPEELSDLDCVVGASVCDDDDLIDRHCLAVDGGEALAEHLGVVVRGNEDRDGQRFCCLIRCWRRVISSRACPIERIKSRFVFQS